MHERDEEPNPMILISEATKLLGKISALISANKVELVSTTLDDQAIQTRALRLPPAKNVKMKEETSPQQDFYFRLADSDLV